MLFMLLLGFAINENIIQENDDEGVQVRGEDRLHEMHESSGCIGEAEGKDKEFIMAVSSSECGFRNIIGMDSDLMISRPKIELAEPLLSVNPIEELLDERKRITIF